jgi:DNA-binding MarR family transcriptional regulator
MTAAPITADRDPSTTERAPADTGARAADVELVLGLQLVLGRLVRQLRRSGSGRVGVSGMSALSALAAAERAGGLRCSDLAAVEGVSAPTMSRIIDSLTTDGLVRRAANPQDGRSSLVQLTAEGHAVLAAVRDDRGRYLLSRLGTLDGDQLRVLSDALPVLAQLAEPAPSAT